MTKDRLITKTQLTIMRILNELPSYGTLTIAQICYKADYNSDLHVRKQIGYRNQEKREKHEKDQIYYTLLTLEYVTTVIMSIDGKKETGMKLTPQGREFMKELIEHERKTKKPVESVKISL